MSKNGERSVINISTKNKKSYLCSDSVEYGLYIATALRISMKGIQRRKPDDCYFSEMIFVSGGHPKTEA